MPDELTHTFPPGEEPEVLTADLCEYFGGCDRCPGTARAGELGDTEHEPEAVVFCIHECHQAKQ